MMMARIQMVALILIVRKAVVAPTRARNLKVTKAANLKAIRVPNLKVPAFNQNKVLQKEAKRAHPKAKLLAKIYMKIKKI